MARDCGILGGSSPPPGFGSGNVGGNGEFDGSEVAGVDALTQWYGGWRQAGQENTTQTVGAGHGMNTSSGSSSVLSEAGGIYNRFETGAAAGDGAGLSTTASLKWSSLNALYDVIWVIRTGTHANDIVSIRWWNYLTSDDTNVNQDLGIPHLVGFRFSTVVPDVNWMSVTSDGVVNTTVTNTGIPVAINTRYILRAKVLGSAAGVPTGVLFGAVANQPTITEDDWRTLHETTLPTASQGQEGGIFVTNQAAGGSPFGVGGRKFFVRSMVLRGL